MATEIAEAIELTPQIEDGPRVEKAPWLRPLLSSCQRSLAHRAGGAVGVAPKTFTMRKFDDYVHDMIIK